MWIHVCEVRTAHAVPMGIGLKTGQALGTVAEPAGLEAEPSETWVMGSQSAPELSLSPAPSPPPLRLFINSSFSFLAALRSQISQQKGNAEAGGSGLVSTPQGALHSPEPGSDRARMRNALGLPSHLLCSCSAINKSASRSLLQCGWLGRFSSFTVTLLPFHTRLQGRERVRAKGDEQSVLQ